jgi:hypothetical protein
VADPIARGTAWFDALLGVGNATAGCMRSCAGGLLAAGLAAAAFGAVPSRDTGLTAEQIVARNAAARGGLDAWRNVRTMVWVGHLESGRDMESPVPFVMQMKRPDKTRFEVALEREKAIRAFDGRQGWKMKPPRRGEAELQPFTEEEVRFAKDAPGMDGPLIDHDAKGVGVELEGADEVEGRRAYRLRVSLPSGTTRHVWVDSATFLEVKYDRESRTGARTGTVSVYYRNYRAIGGLQFPMLIETRSADGRAAQKMVIDRVLLNPLLPDSEFAWPERPAGAPGPATSGARAQELR